MLYYNVLYFLIRTGYKDVRNYVLRCLTVKIQYHKYSENDTLKKMGEYV